MGRGGIEPSTVLVSLRTADDLNEVTKEWPAVGTDELTLAAPGAPSGGVWADTMGVRIGRALCAVLSSVSRDLSWRACCLPTSNLQCGTSSPSRSFSVPRSTKVCKHVPDHLLITDEALSLWMSSLSVAMADPKVAFTLEWTREVVEARGWRYEVATEPSAVEL